MNKAARVAASQRLDLTHRPRRNRKAEWARRLVAEHVLTASDLIWPLLSYQRREETRSGRGDAGSRPAQRR